MIPIPWNPRPAELFWFSRLWLPLFVAAVAGIAWLRFSAPGVAAAAACVGGILAVSAVASRTAARWIYVGLSLATFPIGWAVSHLLMAFVYFGVVTPLGLLARLVGRDRLGLRFPPAPRGANTPQAGAKSYWEPHRPAHSPEQYFRQF